jgi:hypothetical protein
MGENIVVDKCSMKPSPETERGFPEVRELLFCLSKKTFVNILNAKKHL